MIQGGGCGGLRRRNRQIGGGDGDGQRLGVIGFVRFALVIERVRLQNQKVITRRNAFEENVGGQRVTGLRRQGSGISNRHQGQGLVGSVQRGVGREINTVGPISGSGGGAKVGNLPAHCDGVTRNGRGWRGRLGQAKVRRSQGYSDGLGVVGFIGLALIMESIRHENEIPVTRAGGRQGDVLGHGISRIGGDGNDRLHPKGSQLSVSIIPNAILRNIDGVVPEVLGVDGALVADFPGDFDVFAQDGQARSRDFRHDQVGRVQRNRPGEGIIGLIGFALLIGTIGHEKQITIARRGFRQRHAQRLGVFAIGGQRRSGRDADVAEGGVTLVQHLIIGEINIIVPGRTRRWWWGRRSGS